VSKLPFPKTKITCKFGVVDKAHPNGHRGTDFGVAAGTDIPSATDGIVALSQWSDVLGWVVVVGRKKNSFWGYCHMEHKGLAVGSKVHAGKTFIGKVGDTGSASAGAHLHFTHGNTANSVFYGKVDDPVKAIAKLVAEEKAKNA
jgi:murein DD-endopeptidase MepM/ murein hydrolase activator NlpD